MSAYALTGIAFWVGLIGAGYFACVLGARIYDAHERGLARVRNHNRRTTA